MGRRIRFFSRGGGVGGGGGGGGCGGGGGGGGLLKESQQKGMRKLVINKREIIKKGDANRFYNGNYF